MYALFGKKDVRLFDLKQQKQVVISYEDFYKTHTKHYKIILDRADIDFSLEHLKNCNLIDAYKILRCRMKVSNQFENVFLIQNNEFNVFKKSNFYIQRNTINDSDFYKKIYLKNGVFLIENVISEFCKKVINIDKNTWWLYVAKHKSCGIKFVVGIGSGIVFSRTIDFQENIESNVLKTIQYAKRFGLEDEIKIISAVDINIEFLKVFKIQDVEDIETKLVRFLSKNKNIKPDFITENFFKKFLKNHIDRILISLFSCFLILGFWFFSMKNQIYDMEYFISENERALSLDVQDLSNTFKAKINADNFEYIQSIIKFLKESKNPIDAFRTASDVLQKNKIQTEMVSVEKCSDIKIKCKLNKKTFEKLQKSSNEKMNINLIKSQNQINDYEIIDEHEDKIYDVEICIKLK